MKLKCVCPAAGDGIPGIANPAVEWGFPVADGDPGNPGWKGAKTIFLKIPCKGC